jgi:PAS domain S-box-containing protein
MPDLLRRASEPSGGDWRADDLAPPVPASESRTLAPPDSRQDIADLKRVIAALARSEARLRAAGELVGLAVYAWNPQTDALEWDERLRALWGLQPGAPVDRAVFESGIHPQDRSRVREAILACVDPAGNGRYAAEYRVNGRDGVERWLATAGQTTFEQGRPVDFIGAVVDISERKRSEATLRESEARFRNFAEHSTNLLWIVDLATRQIEYRSPAYEQIWGEPHGEAATCLDEWFGHVHPDDVERVRRTMRAVQNGDVTQVEYRITRPGDGETRWLRDTSFPIRDASGEIIRIGGIAEDLTRHDGMQVYLVGSSSAEERRLARAIRQLGFRMRAFPSPETFLDIAAFLTPGCVLVDLRRSKRESALITVELRARSIPLKAIVIGPDDGDVACAIEAMKAGAADYLQPPVNRDALKVALESITIGTLAPSKDAPGDEAAARLARLSTREREVLNGLIDGGSNKAIALKLGISPRTVELHRGHIMAKLNASNLAELLQLALSAGLRPLQRRE